MPDAEVPAEALAVVERIAGAIRNELGEAIDAYPGCRSPDGADPLNRVFGAIVRALLASDGVPRDNQARLVSRTLLRIASGRLEAEGRDDLQVKTLIEDEPGRPDDWLIFLILSSRSQIEPLLDPDRG